MLASLWLYVFATLMAATFLFSIGLAPVFTRSADLVVGAAPEEKAGSAAATAETSSDLGGALGIAVLRSIVASVYQLRVASFLPDAVVENLPALQDGISNAFAQLDALTNAEAEPLHAAIAKHMSTHLRALLWLRPDGAQVRLRTRRAGTK